MQRALLKVIFFAIRLALFLVVAVLSFIHPVIHVVIRIYIIGTLLGMAMFYFWIDRDGKIVSQTDYYLTWIALAGAFLLMTFYGVILDGIANLMRIFVVRGNADQKERELSVTSTDGR